MYELINSLFETLLCVHLAIHAVNIEMANTNPANMLFIIKVLIAFYFK